ncbi:hypothetical protein HDZ31DRAFT_74932 [Schizophyllum fasciatum]
MAKGLNALSPFTTPVRNFFQRPAKRRRASDDDDGADHASSSSLSSQRLALQTNDTDADAVVVTSLDAPPFCCHEDLLTMTPAELAQVADSLNARLPIALRIDTNAPPPAIRAAIEMLVGIRAGDGPPTAARSTPSNGHLPRNGPTDPNPRRPDLPHAPRRIRRLPTNALKLTMRDEDEDEGGPRALLRMDRDPPSSPLAHRAAPPTPAPRPFPRTPTLARIEEEAESPGARPVKRRRFVDVRSSDADDADTETPTWRASSRKRNTNNARAARVSDSERGAQTSTQHAPYRSAVQAARKSATQAMCLPIQSSRRPQSSKPPTDDHTSLPFPCTEASSASLTIFRERTSTASSSAESLCRERTETNSSIGSIMSTGSAMSTSSMYSVDSGPHDHPSTGYLSEDVQMGPSSSMASVGSVSVIAALASDGAPLRAFKSGDERARAMMPVDDSDVLTPVVQQQGWGKQASPTPIVGRKHRAEADEPAGVIDGWTEQRVAHAAASDARPVKKSWTGGMESMRVVGGPGSGADEARLHESAPRQRSGKQWNMQMSSSP